VIDQPGERQKADENYADFANEQVGMEAIKQVRQMVAMKTDRATFPPACELRRGRFDECLNRARRSVGYGLATQ